MDCPVCGQPYQEAHNLKGNERIEWVDIYYGPSQTCISKEKTRVYGHGERL